MKTLPWYKAYPRDFFEGTIGMDFELKGAYRLVLDLIYVSGGRLPDDSKHIAAALGMSVRKWNIIRGKLVEMPGKLMAGGGVLTNYRADEEVQSALSRRYKNRENAHRRWKTNDLADASAMLITRATESDAESPLPPTEEEKGQASTFPDNSTVVALGKRGIRGLGNG